MEETVPRPNTVKIIKIARVTSACTTCRQRKKSCDGKTPCGRCTKLGTDCLYSTARKKRGAPAIEKSSSGIYQQQSKILKTELNSPSPPSQIYVDNSSPESIIEYMGPDFSNPSDFLVSGNSSPLDLEEELLKQNDSNDNNSNNNNLNEELMSFLQYFTNSSAVIPTARNICNMLVPQVNTREQGLLNDAELSKYFADYTDNVAALLPDTMIIQKYGCATSDPQLLAKYAICAYAARACGYADRANQLIKLARSHACESFDNYSLDSVVGFMLLSSFYGANDRSSQSHYISVASSLAKTLPKGTLPQAVECMVFATNLMAQRDIPMPAKINSLVAYLNTLDSSQNWVLACQTGIKVMRKIFLAYYGSEDIDPCDPARYVDMLRNLSNMVYSKAEADQLLVDVAKAESIIVGAWAPRSAKIAAKSKFKIGLLRIFLHWHCGNINEAIEAAVEAADNCTFEFIRFGHAQEDRALLNLATLLHVSGKNEQAKKIYSFAKELHNLLAPTQQFMEIPGIS